MWVFRRFQIKIMSRLAGDNHLWSLLRCLLATQLQVRAYPDSWTLYSLVLRVAVTLLTFQCLAMTREYTTEAVVHSKPWALAWTCLLETSPSNVILPRSTAQLESYYREGDMS
jgi:hypothetical protein